MGKWNEQQLALIPQLLQQTEDLKQRVASAITREEARILTAQMRVHDVCGPHPTGVRWTTALQQKLEVMYEHLKEPQHPPYGLDDISNVRKPCRLEWTVPDMDDVGGERNVKQPVDGHCLQVRTTDAEAPPQVPMALPASP